jgi:SAM-dependent methyltransferase
VTREPRLVFGEIAERYDRARPSYPRELVADVASILRLPDVARVVEVGSGTGKATGLWADAGYEVLGLEPSDEMAAIARRNLSGRENVTIEAVGFEDWVAPGGAFDLVTAAQAWHWVDQQVGPQKAHDVLRPGGGIAVFWNWEGEEPHTLEAAFDDAYRTYAPSLMKPPLKARIGAQMREQLEDSPLFGPVTVRRYPWERVFTAQQYIELLGTHSDHRLLPGDERERLLQALAAAIAGSGAPLTIGYTTEVLIAPRA